MSTQQGLRQASFRAIGGTTGSYNGDAMAAFATEATIPAGTSFDGALLLWINERLGTSHTNLPNAMQAFADDDGAHNWSSVGSFAPLP